MIELITKIIMCENNAEMKDDLDRMRNTLFFQCLINKHCSKINSNIYDKIEHCFNLPASKFN